MSEEQREKLIKTKSEIDVSGEKNPNYGKYWTDEQKNSLSKKAKERWSDPDFKNKQIGENHPMYGKRGKDNPNFGKPCREDVKKKISESLKGNTLSEESRQKLSKALKGKPKTKRGTCIHCGKETDNGNLKQWHNDNCKHKPKE